jgi:uncharacterized membrane protein
MAVCMESLKHNGNYSIMVFQQKKIYSSVTAIFRLIFAIISVILLIILSFKYTLKRLCYGHSVAAGFLVKANFSEKALLH